jgi:hypothetical protein
MSDDLRDVILALPEEAFCEPEGRFASLTHLQRLRWLQQTAYFVWKYRGAARRWARETPESDPESSATS